MRPNFIGQYMVEDLSICDELVDTYYKSDNKLPGLIGNGQLRLKDKQDTEVSFSLSTLLVGSVEDRYLKELAKCCEKYKAEYKFSSAWGPWAITEGFKLQHYKPHEGYFMWHTERDDADPATNNRHLAWMTYLNDVSDGGETEFYYQGLKIKPRKGQTLIWPADWTHTHRGLTSPSQDKYVITGWYSYYNP